MKAGSYEPQRGLLSFAFLCRIGFIVQRPFHCVASLLEFHKRREFCRFLLGADHCGDEFASLPAENVTKLPQVLEMVNLHLQHLCPERPNRALLI